MVHVPKAVMRSVLRHLFQQNSLSMPETWRTCVIEEITYKNEKGEDVHPRNLYVNVIMKSLMSKGYVKDTFCWRNHYYLLTKEGEEYIRDALDIDANIRPDPCTKVIAEKPQEQARQGFRGRDAQ